MFGKVFDYASGVYHIFRLNNGIHGQYLVYSCPSAYVGILSGVFLTSFSAHHFVGYETAVRYTP